MRPEALERIYRDRFIGGNRVTVFYEGRDAFRDLFESIARAERTICLVFYIFRNDATGTELSLLLQRKAREGLRVSVLFDHFGSFMTPGRFWRDLEDSGAEVRTSRPFRWGTPRNYIHRDHRKLVIIDGKKAYTGGLNIADEYRGYALFRRRGLGWRDTAVKVEGPAALRLHEIFCKTWIFWKGRPIPGLNGKVEYFSDGLSVMPIFSSSAKGRRQVRRLLHWCVRQSRKSICMTTAYFTPSRRMIEILEQAVTRGVKVRLLLPSKTDISAVRYAGRFFFSKLLRAGVEIYEYQESVLHAKTYVFDGIFSIVGSANLDFQSLRKNDEGNIGVYSELFASEMMKIFEIDLKKSKKIDPENWKKRHLCSKLKERFFSFFRMRL